MNLSKISDFDPEVDDVDTYILRIKHFLRANRVGEDLKVSTLITIFGTKAVSTLIDLFSPDDLDSKTCDEIIEKFKSHYKPAKLTVGERNKFYTRIQQPNETISDYIVVIKHLASNCNFRLFLTDALRDRLISGVADQELRQKLISEELTFQQACEQARKFEEAEKQKFSFGQTSAAVPNVNAMNKTKIKKNQVQRSVSREAQYSCTRSIPELKRKPLIGDKVSLTTYQGEPLDVLGKIKVNVQDQGNMFQLPLVIVKGAKSLAFALIGRNWLEVLKLDWNKIFDINVIAGNRPENDLDIQKLKKKYAKVFSPQIGEIKGKEVNLHLKPNTMPKFCKARPLPYAIRPTLVDKELDVLEKAVIIARVPYSDWATPIVVVRKSSNAI
ncbi:hypothetical protein JTE90_027631 [Oedothorax gibbosus]|uniref:Retrotransposon gag domain-containing protein n=1 Tax=Oedothorax gibbosus TaxID=931172 RepID=A0AAV6VLM8_9ARAC|nr:hypothetical protein JTE90_027631 [Oedothorax gibbosus]